MDNVTLTLTAVVLSRAGLDRLTPNATAALVFGCNGPSFLPMAFIAAVPRITWRDGLVALIGVGVYAGLRLLELYFDILSSGSPWLIAVLALCVGAPMLSNLVGSEIGASKKKSGRGWALFGMAFLFVWIGAHAVMHQRAIETLQSRIYSGSAPLHVGAWPTQWNPLVWRGYVATEEFWMIEEVPLHREFDPEAGCKIFRPDLDALGKAQASVKFRSLFRRVRYPLFRVTPPKIEVADARAPHRSLCPEFTTVVE